MISYIQWFHAPTFINRLVAIFAVYEHEIIGGSSVKNIKRCFYCKRVLDTLDVKRSCLLVCDDCVDTLSQNCDCICCGCMNQRNMCDLHWLPENQIFCTIQYSDCHGYESSSSEDEPLNKMIKL
jgi:hypothetical protein